MSLNLLWFSSALWHNPIELIDMTSSSRFGGWPFCLKVTMRNFRTFCQVGISCLIPSEFWSLNIHGNPVMNSSSTQAFTVGSTLLSTGPRMAAAWWEQFDFNLGSHSSMTSALGWKGVPQVIGGEGYQKLQTSSMHANWWMVPTNWIRSNLIWIALNEILFPINEGCDCEARVLGRHRGLLHHHRAPLPLQQHHGLPQRHGKNKAWHLDQYDGKKLWCTLSPQT